MTEKKTDSPAVNEGASFTKDQLMASAKFSRRKDLLASILEDGKSYTHKQVEALINEFDKRVFTEGSVK